MQITLATVSDYASVDSQGKLSVMGLFDVLGAASFPVTHPQLFLCLRIQCRPIEVGTQHKFRVVLQDPDGSQLLPPIEGEFTVPPSNIPGSPYSHVQVALGAVGVIFHKSGSHSFEIALNSDHKTSVPLQVVQVKSPALPPGT